MPQVTPKQIIKGDDLMLFIPVVNQGTTTYKSIAYATSHTLTMTAETVDINTENLGGTQDTVNVTTKITERPTGSISGGIGYGSDSGMALQLGVSQTNLFGWGKVGAISAYKNKYRRQNMTTK